MTVKYEKQWDHEPVHVGNVLESYLEYYDMTQKKLANLIDYSRTSLNQIINKKAGVGPKLAHKLALVFDTSVEFWSCLDLHYKLHKSYQENKEELFNINEVTKNERT